MGQLQRVRLRGGPHERGVTHGERFAEQIRENVRTYLERFAHTGVDESTVREQAEAFLPVIEEASEAYAEELRGVAAGSGVPLQDVTLLNVRYEIIYTTWSEEARGVGGESKGAASGSGRDTASRPGTDGCTSFGVLPAATADGHTLLGQNWDWLSPIEDTLFLMDVDGPDVARHLAMTEAGIVGGKVGVNEHGVGLAVNGLISENDGEDPYRKPFHVRCREVLNAERFDRVLASILDTDRACSANFLVGHGDGEVMDVEAAPEQFNCLSPVDGVLTHANHFVDSTITRLGQASEGGQSTLYRAERLRRALTRAAADGGLDTDDVAAGLRDHFSRPESVCRHVDQSLPEPDHVQTNASFVVDLTAQRLLATRGPPCESEYEAYPLAE